MRRLFFLALSTLLFLLSPSMLHAQQAGDISYMSAGGRLKPLQAIMDIRHYTLSLEVMPDRKEIKGDIAIRLNLTRASDSLLFDLYKGYTVSRVQVDQRDVRFTQLGDSLFITQASAFKEGGHLVKIFYGGNPPVAVRPPWKGGFTWSKDKAGNPWVVINCQLEGAKVYFPCKDHPSDEPDKGVDLLITVPKGLSVAGPGLLQKVSTKADKSTWHWKTNYTISNYCVVFNIGRYKVAKRNYTTVMGNTVPMEFYILEQDWEHATTVLDIRERDTRILEKYFGEYPWVKEKIGIAQVSNPGMEHQTMVTFGDRFTFERVGGQPYSANLFHEFAHEWWANKVTNKDWAHMWIQEGITTYAEALAFRELAGERGYDSLMVTIHNRISNQKPVVQGEGLNMAQVYNGDVYQKGAFLMHTLRFVMGDDRFFSSLKKFITDVKHPYHHFFTTDDMVRYFSAESSRDLTPLFDFYLRTTKRIQFQLKKTSMGSYMLQANNCPIDMELEVQTAQGINRIKLKAGKNAAVTLTSNDLPVIDPKGWYFKEVISY